MNTMEFNRRPGLKAPMFRPVAGVGEDKAKVFRAILRATILAVLHPFAVGDAAWQWLVTIPTGSALRAQPRRMAASLEPDRPSRARAALESARLTPVSGIVVANHSSLLDAILLAAVRPCVFVAGAEIRRWPIVGLLARLGNPILSIADAGTIPRASTS